jgi:hypothetical protein
VGIKKLLLFGALLFFLLAVNLILALRSGDKFAEVEEKPPFSEKKEMEVKSNLEPLTSAIFSIADRPFKKTTPQAASKGFNFNMYEYYDVEHNEYKNYSDSLFYKINSKDNGVKYISDIYLYGENINENNCGLYSFLETSNTIFLVCRDNRIERGKGNYWVLGFATLENSTYDFSYRDLNLVLKGKIPAVKGDFKSFFDIKISQVSQHKYYLTTSYAVWVIEPDKSGTLLTLERMETNYYLVDEKILKPQEPDGVDKGWAFDLIYNQTGNLVIFSDSGGGGIIDTQDDLSLAVDKSCLVPLSEELKDEEGFYNNIVDPFTEGPYKNISEAEGRSNTFMQTVQNSGCAYREGYIRLYRVGDTGYCDINIKNELVGC